MRIGIVTQNLYPIYGGIAENVYYTYRELKRLGHEVTIIAPSSGSGPDRPIPVEDMVRIGSSVPVYSNGSISHFALGEGILRRLRKVLDEKEFDILHIHEPLNPTLPLFALVYSQATNVGTFHSCFPRSLGYRACRPLLKRYFNKLHLKIAVSEAARESISCYFPGDYEVIPNGVETARFSNPGGPKRHDDYLDILFVGRLEPRKGLKYLLKAFPHVKKGFPRSRLIVVGDGPLQWYYRCFVDKGIREQVIFKGRVAADELSYLYSTSTILCAPAVRGESFGIVLLEGMASGTPIVASDIEGYRCVLSHGEEGILVKPGDPLALAEAISYLLDEEPVRIRLAQEGRKKAARYDWQRITERLEGCYRSVLNRGGCFR